MRCNCNEPDCPICHAPAHMPWTPKAGTSPDPLEIQNRQLLEANVRLVEQLRWNRWQALRRYLLVLLLALLGGMIGGVASAFTILHYLN